MNGIAFRNAGVLVGRRGGPGSSAAVRARRTPPTRWPHGAGRPPQEERTDGDAAAERDHLGASSRISAVNARVAWASGRFGTFAVTTDGGKHLALGVVPGAETAPVP